MPRKLRSAALDHIGLAEVRLVQREFDEAAEPVKIGETGIGHIVCMTAGGWLIQAAPGIDGGVGLRRNLFGLAA